MTKQEAVAILDSYFWTHVGRKVKDSELNEYVPYFLEGLPDKFFKKAIGFGEVKQTLGASAVSTTLAPGLYQVK